MNPPFRHFALKDGARQFYALKAELEQAAAEAEAGAFAPFDIREFELEAFEQ